MPRKQHHFTPLCCECPCHNPVLCKLDAIRHANACCCPHRYVVEADCPSCGTPEDSP